jgi:sigma-B regulation protein RsbU (phosphoserine phosphatase)
MSDLIVKYPDRTPDTFPLGRLRITIGRSARNDLCIPDPFASRVHAEVRREGDQYILQDLGSANGTLYNGASVEGAVPLTSGGRIQIGETEIVFNDGSAGALGAKPLKAHARNRTRPLRNIRLSKAIFWP